jgi:hypothetical protein
MATTGGRQARTQKVLKYASCVDWQFVAKILQILAGKPRKGLRTHSCVPSKILQENVSRDRF